MFLHELGKRLKFKAELAESISPKQLHDNLDNEILPYWTSYKDQFKKINTCVKYSINPIMHDTPKLFRFS